MALGTVEYPEEQLWCFGRPSFGRPSFGRPSHVEVGVSTDVSLPRPLEDEIHPPFWLTIYQGLAGFVTPQLPVIAVVQKPLILPRPW
jgi:hypothetical protein